MVTGAETLTDRPARRRGSFIAAFARWTCVALSAVYLALVWHDPGVRAGWALLVVLLYAAVRASLVVVRRVRASRLSTVTGDIADAVAIGLGAALCGGLSSPVWLLLYPHVAGVAVRGGLAYALSFGAFDALVMAGLGRMSDQPVANLHALALLFCAFSGGVTSSDLHAVTRRLAETGAAREAARLEQEQALTALGASEERYHRLLERIQDGVLIIQDGRIVYANPAFAQMAGEEPAELAGRDLLALVPPEDRDDILARYDAWEKSQSVSGGLESHLLTRKGHVRPVSVRAGSVEFQGRPSVIATVRDVTRERRLEDELTANAERLAAIGEITSALNLNLTLFDIVNVVAQEARRLVPFDRLTLVLFDEQGPVERLVVEEVPRRDRLAVERDELAWAFADPFAWCEGKDGPPPPHFHELLADPDLRSMATFPLFNKERVVGSLNMGRRGAVPFSSVERGALETIVRNVALALENARLLEAVRRRGREFEALLEIGQCIVEGTPLDELLPGLVATVDQVMGTSRCLLVLRSGEALSLAAHDGVEPEVVEAFDRLRVDEGLSGWVIGHGQSLALLDMRLDPRLRTTDLVHRLGYRSFLGVPLRRGNEILGTLEVVTQGETRHFGTDDEALLTAFADQAAVAIDNTRLAEEGRAHLGRVVEANRRLEELHRLRQDYLRNVSHEFRTPLTIIRGYAEFLRENPGDASLRELLGVIEESCDRLIDMVVTLIDVSRIEQDAPDTVVHVVSLDLRDLLRGSVADLRPAAEKKGVALQVDLPGEALALEGDSGLLQQVVRKLLDNALKYSPTGAQVIVRGRHEGDELSLEVEDSGIGIPPEHHNRIFEKFYTVDAGLSRRAGGAGVGLYLVREIVRLHRGSVTVRSHPGQGSVFAVRLPRRFHGAGSPAALA